MYKKFILLVSMLFLILSISGCVKSQEQIRIEKEHKEQLEKEKIKREEGKREKKYEEARKYLDTSNENDTIYNLFSKINHKFYKDVYETKNEYELRKRKLVDEYFGDTVILDYKPKYTLYNPENNTLYLLISTNPSGFISVIEKYIGDITLYGVTHKNYRKMTTSLRVYFGQGELFKYMENTSKRNKKLKQTGLYIKIKDNCSAAEARSIQSNWSVRFITRINTKNLPLKKLGNESLGLSFLSKNDYIIDTNLIVVYNKNTKEIYKVIY